MYPASLFLKGKAALQGTPEEQQLAYLLLDENMQVLSSFELNQIASFTYGDKVCDLVFEMLAEVLSKPVDHSALCVQKALAVTKHVLIYGSEACVDETFALGRHINALQEYNTILIAQQRQGADAWWQRVKGGGVDKGFPVREAATDLMNLLASKEHVQMMRHTKADPNSLVPIGDDKVAFASDEVRHYILKKRIQEQRLMHTKSNLAKERGGFGSGYQSKDGTSVVGAAHSLEEMMARARKEESKFTDDGPVHTHRQEDFLSTQMPMPVPAPAAPELDLLDFSTSTTEPAVSAPAPVAPTSVDPFAPGDLLSGNNSGSAADTTADLLSLMTVAAPAVSSAPPVNDSAKPQVAPASDDAFKPVADAAAMNTSKEPAKKPVMGGMSASTDRFAALDALSLKCDSKPAASVQSGLEAQNRILGSFNLNDSIGSAKKPSNGNTSVGMSAAEPATSKPLQSASLGAVSLASELPTAPPVQVEYIEPNYAGIAMGASYGKATVLQEEDDENGFVMGGAAGSGLEPTAAAPAAPPPPPP